MRKYMREATKKFYEEMAKYKIEKQCTNKDVAKKFKTSQSTVTCALKYVSKSNKEMSEKLWGTMNVRLSDLSTLEDVFKFLDANINKEQELLRKALRINKVNNYNKIYKLWKIKFMNNKKI